MGNQPEVFESEDLLRKGTQKQIGTKRNCCQKIPFRVWIAVMVFFTTYITYTTRVNMSISIVSMTGGKEKKEAECLGYGQVKNETNVTSTPKPLPDYGPRYEWSQPVQGYVIGAYFYGYTVSSLFGGWLSERLGPFHVVFWSHVLLGILNSVSVYCTYVHYGLLIAVRVVIGVLGGFVYPALQTLIAKWAPPAEKGKFVSCLMGNTLGTMITWPLVGAVTMLWGWDWGFHIVSLQHIVFCAVFFIIGADSPHVSRFVEEKERQHIANAQGSQVSKKKVNPPFLKIFTSFPFWMLIILHFGNLWGLYVQLTTVPKFMAEVVGFDLKSSGGLSALPQLIRLFTGMFFGNMEDFLKSRNLLSTVAIRKGFVLSSHILPGVCLMLIALAKCNATFNIILLVVSSGLNGAATITNLRNPQDLAPNFSGTLFGIMSFFGGFTGFIVPAILGQLTKDGHNGVTEWGYHFLLGGSVYCFCGIIFIIFGSVRLQPWNEIKDEPSP